MKKSVIAVGVAGVALLLSACGAGEQAPRVPAPSPTATVAPSATPDTHDSGITVTDSTRVGADPSTWSPVFVDETATRLSLLSRQHVAFPQFEYSLAPKRRTYLITSSNESVARTVLPDYSMVPSFVAGVPGTATVTVSEYTGAKPTRKNTTVLQSVEVSVG